MASARSLFTKAIYEALAEASAVTDLVSTRIYDYIPHEAAFPYIQIGASDASDLSTKSEDGEEFSITVHSWSQYMGRKEVEQIMVAVHGALHKVDLEVSGFANVYSIQQTASVEPDPDGKTHHGIQIFRIGLIEN